MTSKASRFVGFAVAFVAGTLANSSLLSAQASSGRVSSAGLFDAGLRSAVTGVVRDRLGRPQVGALVELLNTRYGVVAQTFTDDRGQYSLPRLVAGRYQIKASNALFLPTVRPDLRLLANSRVIVNLTLSTLYQALQWLPAEPRTPESGADDWSWTLRLSANRPLLRMLDAGAAQLALPGGMSGMTEADGPVVVETAAETAPAGHRSASHSHRATVRGGNAGFGQGGVQQQLVWTAADGETRGLLLEAHTAMDNNGLGRFSSTAEYRQQPSRDRSMTTVATFTDRSGIHGGAGTNSASGMDGLVTMHVRSASSVRFGDLAEFSAGTDLAFARLGQGSAALGSHPFAGIAVHAGRTTVQYRVATARDMADAESLEREASEDAAQLSEINGRLQMEQALHQELRLSRKIRSWTGEVGVFHDSLRHAVVNGLVAGDEAAIDSGNVLFDPDTGTIAVSGQGYSGGGVLAMLRDQLSPETWLSLRYAMGDALSVQQLISQTPPPAGRAAMPAFAAQRTPMASIAAGTRIAATGTQIRGSYRWQPAGTLTQVAPFDSSAPDAYLGLTVRQPLHFEAAGASRLEAILDVRNLLAEGYRPFLSQDGTTVYFAQAQRCIAGGVSFSF